MRPNKYYLHAVLSLLLALQSMGPALADEPVPDKEPVAPKHLFIPEGCIDVWVGTPQVAGYGIGDSIPGTLVFDVPPYAECQKQQAPDQVKVLPAPAAPVSAAQIAAAAPAPAGTTPAAPVDVAKVQMPIMLPVPQISLDGVIMSAGSGNLSAKVSDVEPLAANEPEEYDLPGKGSPPAPIGRVKQMYNWLSHLFKKDVKGQSQSQSPVLVLPPAPVHGKRIVERFWVTTYVTTQKVGDPAGQQDAKPDAKPEEKQQRPSKHQASFTVDFTYAISMQPDGVQLDWRPATTPELTVGIHRSADEKQTQLEEGDLSPKVSPIAPAAYWLTYWSWPLALPMVATLLYFGLQSARRKRTLTKSERKIGIIDQIVVDAGGALGRNELRRIYAVLRKDLRLLSMTTTEALRWLRSEERKKQHPGEVLNEEAVELVFSQEALFFDPDRPDLTPEECDALLAAVKVLIRRQ
jgi:hypothetical protein